MVLLLTYRLVGGLLLRVTRGMHFAQHVAQGHLEEPIPESSTDEVGLLAASVETMVHGLGEMVEKAEASNKSKSRFLARMSHEIRTPMNARMGMAHLCQHTPILALTAHAFTEDKEKSLVAGMNDYLTKPIDYTVLVNKLVQHVRKLCRGAPTAPTCSLRSPHRNAGVKAGKDASPCLAPLPPSHLHHFPLFR
ncbi:HAMP domain-containing protein [Desulfovibrio cuneatus]|uniref:HAMP domain-containing protein n=1 Tax=Desulfovibrio cuneatus TaxID=159728 RepID=UPI000400AA7E|nr:HAMP domain-containing protein [Desulfovibrio cuneatus]